MVHLFLCSCYLRSWYNAALPKYTARSFYPCVHVGSTYVLRDYFVFVCICVHCFLLVPVPLNGWWKQNELAYAFEDSGTVAIICDEERYKRGKQPALQLHLPCIVCRCDPSVIQMYNLPIVWKPFSCCRIYTYTCIHVYT